MTPHSIAKTFGEKEVRESQESLSYVAHEMQDGVNLAFQSKTTPVITSTAIQSLSPLEAFIKLPGKLPVSKIQFK